MSSVISNKNAPSWRLEAFSTEVHVGTDPLKTVLPSILYQSKRFFQLLKESVCRNEKWLP